jgi:hypothetical protein
MKLEQKLLIAVSAFVLILPTLLRFNQPMPGIETYYYIKQFSYVPELVMRLAPPILGLVSSFLFYSFCRKVGLSEQTSYIAVVLLMVSGPMIYVSNNFTLHFMLLLINFSAFYLVAQNSNKTSIMSIPLFLLTLFFREYAFITALGLLVYYLTTKNSKRLCTVMFILLTVASLSLLPDNLMLPSQGYIQSLVSDFGGDAGIGASALIVAVFGFLITWREKHKFTYTYAAVILLLWSVNYMFFSTIYLNIAVVLFAAVALQALLDKSWELTFIKQISLLALVCTFMFSAVSFVNRTAHEDPSDAVVRSLLFLKTKEPGVVFSHPSKGFWIQHYSGMQTFSDRLTVNAELERSSADLYYSRSYANSTKLMNQAGIKYIWIDTKMKNGQVWTKPDQGLLFLFEDKTLFSRIYGKDSIEIWQYTPQNKTI